MSTGYFETLGDIRPEWMIDLLAAGTPERQFKLLFWDGKKTQVDHTLALTWPGGSEHRVYRPGKVDASVARATVFPTHAAPYGSMRELFEATFSVIQRFSGMADVGARLLTYAALATWVVEFTEVPISLALVGPPSPERRQLLRVLRCLFRRALLLGEASLAGVSSLPMEIAPTLLIERCERSSQFRKFLEATSSRDAQILSKGRIFNACRAKVLCIEEPLSDAMPGWLTIEFPGTASNGRIPVFDANAQQQLMEEFQPKFEMFRLLNYNLVRASAFDLPEINSQARDVARCLGAVVEGDAELQARLAELLKGPDHRVYTETANELHEVVIEALLSCLHQAEKECLGVAEITSTVNKTLERRGESLEMNPRAVGNILRALGFSTQRLSATRRGIFLLNSVRRQIHQLAAQHELLNAHFRSADCAQCDQLGSKEGEDKFNDEHISRQIASMSDQELENPLKYIP
jgi:hypothetical protein